MPSSEVKELRKKGQLEEALAMALKDKEEDPGNIWNTRALSWVYYDFLKKNAEENNFSAFIETLEKVKELNLQAEEHMFYENVIWPLSSMFRSLAKETPKNYSNISRLYNLTKVFPFAKPSDNFSVLFSAIHKAYKDFHQYTEVIDEIGFESLSAKDFLEEEYNGKRNMALAEQVYISYAKHLEEGKPVDMYGNNREVDVEKIRQFMPLLESLIEKHPEYLYPPYYKAKLLLKLESDDVMSSFLPFARKKRNEYWVWQLMAEIFKDNPEIVFASYCKALSLKTKDDFLVKIRQNFARILIQKEKYAEAKCEIENILSVKHKTHTKIPNEVQLWLTTEWYHNTVKKVNNFALYRDFASEAEEILFSDVPEETVVVEFVNRDRKILNFVKDQSKNGFFKYEHHIQNPQIGDVLKVRFRENPVDGRYMVYTLKQGDSKDSKALKKVSGTLEIIDLGIGFVDHVLVDASFIKRHDLKNSQQIQGTAILSYNKKKNQWGWKLISIQ